MKDSHSSILLGLGGIGLCLAHAKIVGLVSPGSYFAGFFGVIGLISLIYGATDVVVTALIHEKRSN